MSIIKRIVMVGVIAFILTGVTLILKKAPDTYAGSLSMKGVWVSCFEYKEIGLYNKSEADFRANANAMFTKIKAYGCNNVFFHVRAHDDAIYPSKVVGWSTYISKKGKALSYDPLKILISLAHKKGLKFHAWMNPYRITTKKILDPSKSATNKRITNQVKEIIKNYKVDGIHFDDYFYPTNQYKSLSKAKKKAYCNAMVKKVYTAVKSYKKSIKFGISPAGNPDYCDEIGADVKTWMKSAGYIDYIAPQIYWSDQYKINGKYTTYFTDKLKEWRSYNTRNIPLYIGLALYKTGYKLSPDMGWINANNNLKKQVKKILNGNTKGYILYTYTDFGKDHAKKELKKLMSMIVKIKLKKTKVKIKKKKKYTLKVTIKKPSMYTDKKGIRYSSANTAIAKVSKKGVITAKKAGTVAITVSYGGRIKRCIVTVK